MPAKVILTITQGKLAGETFVFDERTSCIIGRSKDCMPRVPNDKEHQRISRHHCLLDINPPDVRVRDFGSRNGTWVNGHKIGQREKGVSAEEAASGDFPEYDLKDGDEIRLADTVFRVSIYVPIVCASCGVEIPEEEHPERTDSTSVANCRDCRQKVEKARRRPPRRQTVVEGVPVCAKCGRDVTDEIGTDRQGEFVCGHCRSDPMELLRKMLSAAKDSEKGVVAIEGYEVVKELGRGGMGAVYLARHQRLGRQVALKVMLPQVAASQTASDRFLREMENTRALRHSHVVQAFESGSSHGTFFLTLEYCEGGGISELMQTRGGRLPVKDAVGIALQVLAGLEYAHQAEIPHVRREDGSIGVGRGLVHRDLKPQNIFLARSGRRWKAKVGDYGLAKAFDQAGLSGLTCTGTVAGTPYFMPRQQVLNFRFAQPEVDIWATAASLYTMLTGACPREFPKGADRWQVVLQTKPVPIRQRGAGIPRRLASVIDQALIDDPDIRMKSAAELRQALKEAMR